MFEEKFVELFLVILYFFIFTPAIFKDFNSETKQWVICKAQKFDKTISTMSIFVVFLIVFFVLFRRVVLFLYGKLIWLCEEESILKVKEKLRRKNELINMRVELKAQENLDVPDGKKKKKLASKLKILS